MIVTLLKMQQQPQVSQQDLEVLYIKYKESISKFLYAADPAKYGVKIDDSNTHLVGMKDLNDAHRQVIQTIVDPNPLYKSIKGNFTQFLEVLRKEVKAQKDRAVAVKKAQKEAEKKQKADEKLAKKNAVAPAAVAMSLDAVSIEGSSSSGGLGLDMVASGSAPVAAKKKGGGAKKVGKKLNESNSKITISFEVDPIKLMGILSSDDVSVSSSK